MSQLLFGGAAGVETKKARVKLRMRAVVPAVIGLAAAIYISMVTDVDRSSVVIPMGFFTMGSEGEDPAEGPRRQVYLDDFAIDRYETTNAEYYEFVISTGHRTPEYWRDGHYPLSQEDFPVVGVGWADANAYCRWVGQRLPTEAEWEKACRGPDARTYPWGNGWNPGWANADISAITRSRASEIGSREAWAETWQLLQIIPAAPGDIGLRPVGSYSQGASPYGVMDMVGNASEWVFDWYNWSDYSAMPNRNPVGWFPPWNHSLRGSAWYDPVGTAASVENASRCSARNSSHTSADPRVGFRCAVRYPDQDP